MSKTDLVVQLPRPNQLLRPGRPDQLQRSDQLPRPKQLLRPGRPNQLPRPDQLPHPDQLPRPNPSANKVLVFKGGGAICIFNSIVL